jgi:hypothetical protein
VTELPPGVITSADLYRKMEDLQVSVVKALGKIDVFDQNIGDHEGRLRRLESFKYALMGAATLAGAASGVISNLLITRGHV